MQSLLKFIIITVVVCSSVELQAQVISGPNGKIISAATAAGLFTTNGGNTDPIALIDGVTNGSSGTWVEYFFEDAFYFTFDQAYNVDEFRLWNDRGVPDAGIGDFTLRFHDGSPHFEESKDPLAISMVRMNRTG